MERMTRWQYYVSSYIRIEPTEGVKRGKMHKSVLTRNVPSPDTDAEEPKPIEYKEDLTLQICANSYKIIYKKGGSEYFIYTDKSLGLNPETGVSAAKERLQKFQDARKQRFKEKFEMNNAWMKDLNHDQVSKITMDFKKWTDEGVLPGTEAPVASGSGDVEMTT
jgi:paired amphipathic helix protein Sin3a